MNRRNVNRGSNGGLQISTNASSFSKSLSLGDVEIIKKEIKKRYVAEKKALDLTNFSQSRQFVEDGKMMNLTKGNVMSVVADILRKEYSHLLAISFSNNRLCHLENLAPFFKFAKHLKHLDLSHNQIFSAEEITFLGKVLVESVVLEGNPICETFSKVSDYVNCVQRLFPKCTNLDGNKVETKKERPGVNKVTPFKSGFYGNADVQKLVEEFIETYYQIYDGVDAQQNRKKLIDAYDSENSSFTLTIVCIDGHKFSRYPDCEAYKTYLRSSHDVLHQGFFAGNRSSRTARGAMDIAVTLSKLPATIHQRDSFVVDVFMATPHLLGFTIHGLFRDGFLIGPNVKTRSIADNFFTRTFLVAPREGGRIAVVTDQLFVSSMSKARKQGYRALLDSAK